METFQNVLDIIMDIFVMIKNFVEELIGLFKGDEDATTNA